MNGVEQLTGRVIVDRFEIIGLAGAGGMGTVYRAKDRMTGADVALKLLPSGPLTPETSQRFLREAAILSTLHHPGIVTHIAHGQAPDGQLYLAMEWLEGQDLSQKLQNGRLPVDDCLTLLERVCDALQVVHEQGIIHRDLKPSNLFLVDGDVQKVKILDFGLSFWNTRKARITKSGALLGTPEYMAPEQARGYRYLTPAADMFSVGCILYECLSGWPAFSSEHLTAILLQILFKNPSTLSGFTHGIPDAVGTLVNRLLAKSVDHRISNAAMCKKELALLTEAKGMTVEPTFLDRAATSLTFVVLASVPQTELRHGCPASDGTEARGIDLLRRLRGRHIGSTKRWPYVALSNDVMFIGRHCVDYVELDAFRVAQSAILLKKWWPSSSVVMVGEHCSAVFEAAARLLKDAENIGGETHRLVIIVDDFCARALADTFHVREHESGHYFLYGRRGNSSARPK